MKSKFHEILKNTSLEARLSVSNQAMFIALISELGYRENKSWGEDEDEDELLNKLCKLADEHTTRQIKTINKWESDGRP